MTRNEKSLLVTGVFAGLIIAVSLYGVRAWVSSRQGPGNVAPPEAAPVQDVTQTAASVATLELTADEQKSIGVETTEVKRQTIRKEIVSSGKVEEPETGIGAISARISGRIDKLFLNITGETVTRGQPVALIYSPDIVTSVEEYRLSLENRERLSASKEAQAITEADELVKASRRRLELRGLTPQQIDDMAGSREGNLSFTTYSAASGVVTKRNVAEGQYIKEGDVLYTVADLSTVWVQANIFESDVPLIRNGAPARITGPALGGGTLRGNVSFLQPAVDPQTRTMTARIQVANPQMRLRPGMFVQVSFDASIGTNVVAVPRSAVLDAGKEKVVYVARDNGVFEKRPIEAMAVGDDYYAATKGIDPGERVVTKGNFLIDSQTRLTGNITGMFGGSKAFGTETASPQLPVTNYSVSLRQESPAKAGSENAFHVTVTDSEGKSVTDAQVQIGLMMPAMPAMGMPEMRSSVNLAWNGSEYTGTGPIAMAGSWNVTVEARRGGQLLGVYRTRLSAQ